MCISIIIKQILYHFLASPYEAFVRNQKDEYMEFDPHVGDTRGEIRSSLPNIISNVFVAKK